MALTASPQSSLSPEWVLHPVQLSVDLLRLAREDLEFFRLVLLGFSAEFSGGFVGGLDEVVGFGA